MASCATLSDILLSQNCTGMMGGIKKVWMIDYDEITAKPTVSTGKITAAPTLDSAATGFVGWRQFEFRKQTSSMTSTLNLDDATGLNYVSTDLAMVFSKMETSKRTAVSALGHMGVAAVVLDSNGLYWYLGYDNPMTISAGTGETGTSFGDANQYTLTMNDMSVDYPYEIDATSIDTWYLDNGGVAPQP